MSFADDLRNTAVHTKTERELRMEDGVRSKIKEFTQGIKALCMDEAKKGKTSISGFVGTSWEEYADTPTAFVSSENAYTFEPVKEKGEWRYELPYHLDYGMRRPNQRDDQGEFLTNQERYEMAVRIKDGVMGELAQCGFSQLQMEILQKPYYETYFNSFMKVRFRKSKDLQIHVMKLFISWN